MSLAELFNLFVFLEIVSIATYGLLSLRETPEALSAAFKYLMTADRPRSPDSS